MVCMVGPQDAWCLVVVSAPWELCGHGARMGHAGLVWCMVRLVCSCPWHVVHGACGVLSMLAHVHGVHGACCQWCPSQVPWAWCMGCMGCMGCMVPSMVYSELRG